VPENWRYERDAFTARTKEPTMMYWGHNGMNGWGFALMSVSTTLFWVLLIVGIVLLIRYLGDHSTQTPDRSPQHSSAEEILAERFARCEIDEDEYRHRREALRGQDGPREPGGPSLDDARDGEQMERGAPTST
jgi:putative membrane protein